MKLIVSSLLSHPQELNRFERATEWIRHAFVITEKIFGVHHEATQDVYGILKVIESRVLCSFLP